MSNVENQSQAAKQDIKMCAIMPNYNCAQFLRQSIQSLVDQTEPFDEIIVVDDGSTDNSVEVLQELMQKHSNIRLIRHEKNKGVNAGVNTGLEHTDCDYVLMCAADDSFGPNIVATSKRVAREYPGIGVICGDAIVTRYDLKQPFYRMLPFPSDTYISPDEFKKITRRSYVGFNGAGGMFLSRKAVYEAGVLHPETRWHGDWLLYFVIAMRRGMYYLNQVFINIDMRAASYSEGKSNWKVQSKVMLDTMHIIYKHYPDIWQDFKKAALVPHHDLRYIPLFLSDPVARKFVTLPLIWKMLINNSLVVRIGRLFPYKIVLTMRKLLRA